MNNIDKSHVYVRNQPREILTGGRLFFELKFSDIKYGSVWSLIHHGSVDYGKHILHYLVGQSNTLSSFSIVHILIWSLLLILILCVLFFILSIVKRKFYPKSKSAEVNMRELMIKGPQLNK